MITTIVFDIGGVFFHQPDDMLADLWRKHGYENSDSCNQIMYGDLWEVYKRGGMSEEEYWQKIADELSLPSAVCWRALRDDFERAVVLDKELVELVKWLRDSGSYRIHALSNAGAELERRLHQFEILDLFDVVINSHYVELAKPDEEIYRLTSKLVKADPGEILFVDDKVRNTSVAKQMGFHVHVYTTAKNLLQDMVQMIKSGMS